jgi:elongation factor P
MPAVPVQKVSNGMKLVFNDDVWTIVEFAHRKPGKGGAFVRIRMKSLTTGRVHEANFQASERVEEANVSYQRMSYLYQDGTDYVFMNASTYDQIPIDQDLLGEKTQFLTENLEVSVVFWDDRIVAAELPAKVELRVVQTDTVDRGNTATNVMKDATLETGYVAQVPLFVNTGDIVVIDTRDGAYEARL